MCVCTGLRNYVSQRKRILAANGGAGGSLDRSAGEVGIKPNERTREERTRTCSLLIFCVLATFFYFYFLLCKDVFVFLVHPAGPRQRRGTRDNGLTQKGESERSRAWAGR